jgi:DNA-binding NarL/FixJ family response regulator
VTPPMLPGTQVSAATRALVVDDAAGVADLFGAVLSSRLGWDVEVLHHAMDVTDDLAADGGFDVAIVDLSFPGEQRNGLDVLLTLRRCSPATRLVVLTQGDDWVADLLRDTWEALPLACALSKTSTLDQQIERLTAVAQHGTAPPDPVLRPWLPATRSPWRSADRYGRLVAHVGHAKLWQALIDGTDEASYRQLAAATGLKLNTIKNYRSQLLGELALHGLDDPSMREMRAFARRCRPLLEPHIAARFGSSGVLTVPDAP